MAALKGEQLHPNRAEQQIESQTRRIEQAKDPRDRQEHQI
jgi:hypothetical protein